MAKQTKEVEPIIIVTNNVTDSKLKAILNISQAICDIAKALNSVTTTVNVSNCTINNAAKTGIEIQTAD
jgi:hypothetical protein